MTTTAERNLSAAVHFRVGKAEHKWFKAVAAAQGLTLSQLVRGAIAAEAVRIGVEPPAPAAH